MRIKGLKGPFCSTKMSVHCLRTCLSLHGMAVSAASGLSPLLSRSIFVTVAYNSFVHFTVRAYIYCRYTEYCMYMYCKYIYVAMCTTCMCCACLCAYHMVFTVVMYTIPHTFHHLFVDQLKGHIMFMRWLLVGIIWMFHWTGGLCSELQYGETPPTEAWPAQQWYGVMCTDEGKVFNY